MSSDLIGNSTDDASDLTISTPYPTKVAICFISSFGFVANIFVVVTIINYRPMRKSLTDVFIANQSTIDATAAVFLMFTTLFEDDHTPRTPGNTLDEFMCRVWYTKLFLWGFLLSSTCGIVVMSLEKYLAVVHPVWYSSKFARNRAIIAGLLVMPWVLGVGILIGYSVPTTRIKSSGLCTIYSVWPSPQTQIAVGVTIFALQYFLPFTTLVYLYSRMAYSLHKRVAPTLNLDPNGATVGAPWRNATMARARTNVIKTLATVSLFYVLCWSSNQLYYVLYNTGFLHMDLKSNFYSATVILVFLNCCVNPVIYSVRYKQFQNGVVFLFRRRKISDLSTGVIPAITVKNELSNDGIG